MCVSVILTLSLMDTLEFNGRDIVPKTTEMERVYIGFACCPILLFIKEICLNH